MPELVFDESASLPTMEGYQVLSEVVVNIFYKDCSILHRSEDAIIFSDIYAVSPELLDALVDYTDVVLFPLLNGLNIKFFFVIYSPRDNSTVVISDRIGQFKLFFTPCPAGFRLADRLPNLGFAGAGRELSTGALSEYMYYRWNNTADSFYADTSQIFHGCRVIIRECKIQARVRYSNIFWGHNYLGNGHPSGSLKDILLAGIRNTLDESQPTCVLLSGGVDSAVLLALVAELTDDVTAITPTHEGHDNPELGRAIAFAKKIGVRHEILTIPNTELEDSFIETTRCVQQPPRHHSSLTLFRTFQSLLPGTNVLYGEAADTLFGSSAVKSFRARQLKISRKNRLCTQFPIIEKLALFLPRLNKVRRLISDDHLSTLLAVNRLGNPVGLKQTHPQICFSNVRDDFVTQYQLTERLLNTMEIQQLVGLFKQWLMDTTIANHFLETGQMASHFKLHLANPFVDQGVIHYAMQLADKEYFGRDLVKPLLRELGTEYYGHDMMHLPKLGFPVPHESWLENELSDIVRAARARYPAFAHLPKNSELDWTLAGFSVLDIDL